MESMVVTVTTDASEAKRLSFAEAVPARSGVPAIKRGAKVILTLIAFVIAVTAIVALKSWIWIPHIGR
jgi:hypothetical protein